ncbi:hypothetical protein OG895_45610 [Streptomyces sp. NBC_00201]|uniref:hypothetical protein n=1 Tax=unclassified Streptomyces TaxID=2593676 RepID=UPI002251524C|nr:MULTISPECIES: hypothetical protein [unclassified Streptomyces]MCX5252313.1 hypothetical protein [Streptomyces sp. NBC_00201]MCX5290818.1 hypothetical protein [Streptomyces sp. NBC_00183]
MSDDKKHPETAGEEVLREIEGAETRTREAADEQRRRGEAADAITPDAQAQEKSEGD